MRIPGDMEKIWEHLIGDQLGVDYMDSPVLSTHCPIFPSVIRTMACETFFEKLHVPSFYFAANAVLSLPASNRTTGVVLDSGGEVTYIVPIHEGVTIRDAICNSEKLRPACHRAP